MIVGYLQWSLSLNANILGDYYIYAVYFVDVLQHENV